MAVVNPPAWLQAGEYPAHTDRLVTASIVQEQGVVQVGDLAVTASSTPGMSVRVAEGRAWIKDASPGAAENRGMYNFVNNGEETLAVTPSHASLARLDRVVAQIEDADVSGAVNAATLRVIAGTPASSPSLPALPPSSLALKTISVPANATTITSANLSGAPTLAKVHKSMIDPVTVVTSSSRPTGDDRTLGMMIYETDTQRDWRWNGDEWQFRGGRGPRAFVSRPGSWDIPMTPGSINGLEAATGSNFETAYFTFVNSSAGDRIKVKQSGMYALDLYMNVANFDGDFQLWFNADIVVGNTGLIDGRVNFPSIHQTYVRGRSRPFASRVMYLPLGAEVRYSYEVNRANTEVTSFWASATLIG